MPEALPDYGGVPPSSVADQALGPACQAKS